MGKKSKKNQGKNSKQNSNQNLEVKKDVVEEELDTNQSGSGTGTGYPVTSMAAASSSLQTSANYQAVASKNDGETLPALLANPSSSLAAPPPQTSLLSSAVAKSAQSTPISTPARPSTNNASQSTSTSAAPVQPSSKSKKSDKTKKPGAAAVPGPIPVQASTTATSSAGSSHSTSHSTSKSKDIPTSGTSASRKLFESPDRGVYLSGSPSSHSMRRQQQLGLMTAARSISRSPADALLSKSIPKAIPRSMYFLFLNLFANSINFILPIRIQGSSNASPNHLKVATPSSVFMNAAMSGSMASGARGAGSGFESDGGKWFYIH